MQLLENRKVNNAGNAGYTSFAGEKYDPVEFDTTCKEICHEQEKEKPELPECTESDRKSDTKF